MRLVTISLAAALVALAPSVGRADTRCRKDSFGTTVCTCGITRRQDHPVCIEFETQYIFQRQQRRICWVGSRRHCQSRLVQIGQVARQQTVRGKHHDLLFTQLARSTAFEYRLARGI